MWRQRAVLDSLLHNARSHASNAKLIATEIARLSRPKHLIVGGDRQSIL